MFNFTDVLILIFLVIIGALLAVSCVVAGAWLMWKGKSTAVYGEKFLGGVPKGEAFVMPDTDGLENDLGAQTAEKTVSARTEEFLKKLGGEG